MKVKNNTKNLIPRKLIGGFILKYREPTDGIRRLGVYKGRSYGVDKAGNYRFLNTSQNVWLLVAKNKLNLKQQQPEVYKYFSNVIDGTEPFRGKPLKQNKGPVKGKWFIAQNDWNYNGKQIKKGDTYLISTKDNSITIKPKNKLTDTLSTQNQGTQGKPAGTRGNGSRGGIRGSGTRGNTRTTVKPATTTFTESPTNITDQSWLDARNAAMQRGWGTYNYNGLTYRFTGDEFLQAKRNWNNRRKAGYQAEGILNLPGITVPDNLIKDNNEAREIESTVPLTKPVDTKTTPYTFYYQLQIAKNPNLTREALWQATQAVRNDDRDASYYGESSDLVSQLANANQDSAKNYIYNLWNTDNDVATQAGRKNYTESQGLTFGEPTTSNANKDPLQSWATDFLKRSARQGTKLIRRK